MTEPSETYNQLWLEGWDAGSTWMPIKRTQFRLSRRLLKQGGIWGDVLDIGGGNGEFWRYASDIRLRLESLTISDLSSEALSSAAVKGFKTLSLDLCSQAHNATEFDNICCFEVFEHLKDDLLAMRNCRNLLRPGGNLFFSVPRFMNFWSHSDELSHHVRRYESGEMKRKLEAAGFDIVSVFNWGSFLFKRYQLLKDGISPSFATEHKRSIFWRLSGYLLYVFFFYEDIIPSDRGVFLYGIAKKKS